MKLLQRLMLSAIGGLMTIGGFAMGLPVRPTTTTTIAPLPTTRLNVITNLWGGNQSVTDGPNFGLLVWNGLMVYQDAIGQIAWVILFAMPFIMMWIVQADMTLPAIIGMLFSLYVFMKLPSQYVIFGVGCFAIALAALLWSLYKRAY